MKSCKKLISQMTSKRNHNPKVCCSKAVEVFLVGFSSLPNSLFIVCVLLAREISWPNFITSYIQQNLCGSARSKSQWGRSSCDKPEAQALLVVPHKAGPYSTWAVCLQLSAVNLFVILVELNPCSLDIRLSPRG